MEAFESEFIRGKQLQLATEPGLAADKEQLLTFYRERFAKFEEEREDWLRRLEQLRGRQDDYLRTQWELRKREEEISSLQKQLSDTQLQLLQERQQVLKLTSLTDQLQLQQRADRKKVLDLLQLTETTGETTESGPKTVTRTLSTACSICKYCREGPSCKVHGTNTRTQSVSRGHKAVSLPNEDLNLLKLELEGTKKQLELQVASHEAALNALQDDRRVREEEAELRQSHSRQQLSDLQESLNRSENAKSEAIKDYLLARHNALNRERQQAELNQTLQTKLDHAFVQLKDTATYYKAQSMEAERIADEKTNDFAHCFRVQVVEGEENLQVVKEQYRLLQRVYSEKVQGLEGRLGELGEKYRDLELRRNLETQGYRRDVEQLRTVVKKQEEGEKEVAKTLKRGVEVKQCQRCVQKGITTQGKSISSR